MITRVSRKSKRRLMERAVSVIYLQRTPFDIFPRAADAALAAVSGTPFANASTAGHPS